MVQTVMKTLVLNEEHQIAKLTCNFLPSLVRHDRMEDRDFLVVPMVILTEGVHNGSEGAFYYPKEELSKTPAAWNHKPVVVYHPTMNGVGISACDPVVINNRKVGLMMNTRFEAGKLKSEAWLEKDRANKVDERIMQAVEKGEMMELSTGVYIDNDMTPGDWNGESYVGIARNYRPDHLALLPDKIGACSIKDGAGLLRNERATALITLLKEMGIDDVRITGRTVEGAFVGNRDQTENKQNQGNTMEKKQIVDAIIGNSGWSETDREKLMGLSEDQLKSIQDGINPPKVEPVKPEPKVEPTKNTAEPAAKTTVPENVVTLESYISGAPREIQDVLNNSLSIYTEEKGKLVAAILANKNNSFSKEDLDNRPLGELKSIARLAAGDTKTETRQANYGGQAPVPTGNDAEEALPVPAMNFAKA